ncbi:MAG: M14 family metallocarboxypeptidase [Gemmatimonadota bacterium]|nr:M14 family metallocarboxypeptidase [Gemmatimonadota bacterium]
MAEGHDFDRLTRRLEALDPAEMEMETAGFVDGYPIYCIRMGGDPRGRKRVFLSGGVHGDEPAGPEAVLAFLERNRDDLLRYFTFLVLPCVNPWGYVHNKRENSAGDDINRSFSESGVPEGEIARGILNGERFDLYVDFHEDWEAAGFYMYEGRRDEQWAGPSVIREVERVGAIDPDGEDDEIDIPISRGVYGVAPSWGTGGIVPYVFHHHADHVLIFETPTSWPMAQRTDAHLAGLDTVLDWTLGNSCRDD